MRARQTGAQNIGIVLPGPGYHDALRALTRKHGTSLVIDETHTICARPGGATRAWGLETPLTTHVGGIGGTRSGNALSLAAMGATLGHLCRPTRRSSG